MNENELLPVTKLALHKRDLLWKSILEDMFPDFLCFFFATANEVLDMERGFEFLEKELHEITPGSTIMYPRIVDKLVKVWYKDGTEKWLLIHIEVQGYCDTSFPARMFTYFYRIYDKFQQRVTSLVILTDENDKYHPDRFEYDCFGTHLLFSYNTYKIKAQDPMLLEKSDNPFAIVILTVLATLQKKGGSKEQLLKSSVALVRRMYKKAFSKEKITRLLLFIRQYVDFGDSGQIHKFEEEIKEFTPKTEDMGIIEQVIEFEKEAAEERGKWLSKISIIRNLLNNTDHSIQTIADLVETPIDFVIKVKNSLAENAA